jgi:hypothetical protein
MKRTWIAAAALLLVTSGAHAGSYRIFAEACRLDPGGSAVFKERCTANKGCFRTIDTNPQGVNPQFWCPGVIFDDTGAFTGGDAFTSVRIGWYTADTSGSVNCIWDFGGWAVINESFADWHGTLDTDACSAFVSAKDRKRNCTYTGPVKIQYEDTGGVEDCTNTDCAGAEVQFRIRASNSSGATNCEFRDLTVFYP